MSSSSRSTAASVVTRSANVLMEMLSAASRAGTASAGPGTARTREPRRSRCRCSTTGRRDARPRRSRHVDDARALQRRNERRVAMGRTHGFDRRVRLIRVQVSAEPVSRTEPDGIDGDDGAHRPRRPARTAMRIRPDRTPRSLLLAFRSLSPADSSPPRSGARGSSSSCPLSANTAVQKRRVPGSTGRPSSS